MGCAAVLHEPANILLVRSSIKFEAAIIKIYQPFRSVDI